MEGSSQYGADLFHKIVLERVLSFSLVFHDRMIMGEEGSPPFPSSP
jgi:hypothetical protein